MEQQLYAFALSGRLHGGTRCTQGVALGYELHGLSARTCTAWLSDEHGKCNGHGGPCPSNHGKCNGHGGRNRTVGCALKGQQSHSPGQRPGITYRINNRPERAKARWHTPLSNDITKTTTG